MAGLLGWAVLGPAPGRGVEIYADNASAGQTSVTGSWPTSAATPGYYATNYAHDNNAGKGQKSFTFIPNVAETGTYEVYLRWTSGANRAAQVPVDVNFAGGNSPLLVNQQEGGGQWVLLGAYPFNAGTSGSVVVRNQGTAGYVVADAVKLVLAPPADGLVSHWSFDEGAGATAYDAMAYENGTLCGNAAWAPAGKMHGGVVFDGANDYVQVSDRPEYGGPALSVFLWFSPELLDGQARGIISKRAGIGNQVAFSVFLHTNNKIYIDIGSQRFDTGCQIADLCRWHHLGVVFDGSLSSGRLKLYLDGVLRYQGQGGAAAVPDTPAPLFIGTLNAGYATSFKGFIDDTRIYNRALAPVEMGQLKSFAGDPVKLPLAPAMVLNEGASGDGGRLVDEQALAGDPLNGTGGMPVTKVAAVPDGANWYFPMSLIIDLGAAHQLSAVAFYDSNNTGLLTISSGSPFEWAPLISDNQTAYNTWRVFPVDTQTRYLQVAIGHGGAVPAEIVVYGTPLGTPLPEPDPVPHTPPPFEKFMGATSYPKEPLHRQEAVGILREFHDWAWCEGHGQEATYPGYPGNLNAFAPAYTGRNYDLFYEEALAADLEAFPAVQLSTRWLVGTGASLDDKPILQNSSRSPLDPASYIEHADHLFQYVARYGGTVVADALLKLRSDQPRLSGLNRVRYYEDWNEQNKWWKGRNAYFTPYEYAAMASASADGHGGTMGATVGIKNADPGAAFVMAGMARADAEYIKAMKLWCDYYRSGDFPWDVINVHFYSNDGGGQYAGTIGVSPEAGALRARMEAIRQYRDRHLPGVEFWVTEFGYDTHPDSPQRAPAIGSFPAEEVQGQWLVRSYLELAAAGVDRAFVFSMADGGGSGRYGTSGLLKAEWEGYVPKISWWYVYTLKNRLKGLRFEAEQASGNSNVKVYRFKNAAGAVKAYAVWCPTSNGTTVASYQLALQGSPQNASLVALQSGDPDGVRTALAITGGKVTVPVSERPVIVLIDYTEPDFVLSQKLVPAGVVNESGLGNANMLIDEQAVAGDPREPGGGGAPTTVWSPGAGQASAYIDLGQVRQIDRIYLRDVTNAGNLIIEAGAPGNWTVLKTDPLNFYMSWNRHVVSVAARYIRLTRTSGGANVAEVVVYGK